MDPSDTQRNDNPNPHQKEFDVCKGSLTRVTYLPLVSNPVEEGNHNFRSMAVDDETCCIAVGSSNHPGTGIRYDGSRTACFEGGVGGPVLFCRHRVPKIILDCNVVFFPYCTVLVRVVKKGDA